MELKEIKITQFEKVIEIQTKDIPRYEKELAILKEVTGQNEEYLLNLPLSEVDTIMNNLFNTSGEVINGQVTINGQEFTLKGDADNFDFTYGQYRIFEQSLINKDSEYIPKFMAAIYVNDMTSEERAYFFREHMTMDVVSPFIMLLEKRFKK